ncbi:MAG: hypothetical protein ABR511_11680 [Acidimicrobiales bacterium]
MYQFATVALFGLAVFGVTGLVVELLPGMERHRILAGYVLAVAAVVALDWSVLAGFGIHVRATWMGPWATGLIVGSAAEVWAAVLGWLHGPERAGIGTGRAGERPRIAA